MSRFILQPRQAIAEIQNHIKTTLFWSVIPDGVHFPARYPFIQKNIKNRISFSEIQHVWAWDPFAHQASCFPDFWTIWRCSIRYGRRWPDDASIIQINVSRLYIPLRRECHDRDKKQRMRLRTYCRFYIAISKNAQVYQDLFIWMVKNL